MTRGDNNITISFKRRKGSGRSCYQALEYSTDLINWTEAPIPQEASVEDSRITIATTSDEQEVKLILDPSSIDSETTLFSRLKVEETE